jgi:hypothetical protein
LFSSFQPVGLSQVVSGLGKAAEGARSRIHRSVSI